MSLIDLHRPRIRSERELNAVFGEPLLAARPLVPEALRALAQQLLAYWFNARRSLLPVISARTRDGRSSLAAELARTLAAMGIRTLLIDADLRSPSLHNRFSIGNEGGLADFLEGRGVRLAACGENLAVLAAGRVREDPLELLSRERLRRFLAAAARPFRVVIADTPAASRGPDHEMFSALAGGALVVIRKGEDARRLARLRRRLARCAARPVAAVFNYS
jgi:protein-tyrosine kinase